MRRILPLIVSFAACSSGTTSSYYRDRALLHSQTEAEIHSMEKVELSGKPYSRLISKRRSSVDEGPRAEISSASAAAAELSAGNARFVAGDTVSPRQGADRRSAVVAAQKPHTVILSCSDSRVPPEVVFDQGIGDLFIIRTAGEVADSAAIASIEYAVEHVGVKQILVMGHTSCGAVKATLGTPRGQSAGSKELDKLIAGIGPNVASYTVETAGPNLESAVRAQVDGVAKSLLVKLKIVKEAVEHHGVSLAKGIYHLDSGRVDIWY